MLKSYYIFMMETLVHHGRPAKGAVDLLNAMNRKGTPYIILSEQSGRTREEMVQKMGAAGFRGMHSLDIYTSSMAAADWIRWVYPQKNKAVMIGGKGMKEALEKADIEISHISPDWLFLGMNTNLTYIDYCDALQVLAEGAQLIVTDGRRTMIKENAEMIGNGSVAHMLEYASQKESISFARGSDRLLKQGMKYIDVIPENITLVGTHFKKDIAPAITLGMTTVYVTQGTSIADLGMNDDCHPDYIVEDLFGLAK